MKTGIAAHISAAAPGGPRFDPSQTEEERRSINNAIWLCHSCSDLVDKDESKFTRGILVDWKRKHEQFVMDDGGAPVLPEIQLETLEGLTLPDQGPVTIRGDDISSYREHRLTIHNPSARLMQYLQARIQFPEPVHGVKCHETPVGSAIRCVPDRMQFITSASAGGAITVMGSPRPPLDVKLALDALPPRGRLVIHFFSRATSELPEDPTDALGAGALMHYLLGEFQCVVGAEFLCRKFLVPLTFDRSARKIISLGCEELDGSRILWERSLWW